MRLNPIVATLGTNALLYGAVLWYSAGIPTTTTARLAKLGGGLWLGIPIPVYVAVATTAVVTAVVKLTPVGRRFEGVGANETAARIAGIRVKRYRGGAYVWAQILYCLAAVLHAGIVNQPTAHEGDNYLLAVRRSGRARGHVAARRSRQPRRDRGRCSLPVAARPVRARARSDIRHSRARPGGGARGRRRALHHQLAGALAAPIGVAASWRRAGLTRRFAHDVDITHKKGRTSTMNQEKRWSASRARARDRLGHGLRGDVVREADGGREAGGGAVVVWPEEDLARFDGRVRRKQLASRDDRLGAGRGGQVSERDLAHAMPTARATRRRRSPTSRAWSRRASMRSSSSRTPARRSCLRCPAPTRPAS